MYVNNVGPLAEYKKEREQGEQRDPSVLGKDQFLQLLITQLRHQDPINPIEDKEFVAQLAQFSSLEQMQNLNTNMGEMMLGQQKLTALGQATQMIGQQVELFTKQGESLFGKVGGVQFKDGWPLIMVDGQLYDFGEVVSIRGSGSNEPTV